MSLGYYRLINPPDVHPKIFRRCVDALRWAGGQFQPGRDLDDFLAAKPGGMTG